MAVKELKDPGASVLTRLKMQSKETGLAYQTCLQLFAQEEFLRKLEKSRYAENLILKGGMFLYTLTNFEGRPTMDIDFLLRHLSNELDSVQQIMEEICSTHTRNDFITMDVIGVNRIALEKKYPGVKTKFRAHIKNVRIPFSIDIGVNDIIVPCAIKREVRTRLKGFQSPIIYTYSLESTIAEKFEAILKRMTATSRMKDFYDLYYISRLFEFDGRKLQEAVYQTLEHRGTPREQNSFEQIKAFCTNKFLLLQWENYEPGAGLEKPSFEIVIEQICHFLEPIYDSIIYEYEFLKYWSDKENAWLQEHM